MADLAVGIGPAEIGVEEVEALRDAGGAAEKGRGHDRARRVAAVAQKLLQETLASLDRGALVADAGLERQPPREHRDVSRQRLRRARVRALEEDAVGRERADGGG